MAIPDDCVYHVAMLSIVFVGCLFLGGLWVVCGDDGPCQKRRGVAHVIRVVDEEVPKYVSDLGDEPRMGRTLNRLAVAVVDRIVEAEMPDNRHVQFDRVIGQWRVRFSVMGRNSWLGHDVRVLVRRLNELRRYSEFSTVRKGFLLTLSIEPAAV